MYVVISVSDTGIGIDSGHYNQIFQRFLPGGKGGENGGVGNRIISSPADHHLQGGYIKVRSKAGYGTEFEVFLPRRAA